MDSMKHHEKTRVACLAELEGLGRLDVTVVAVEHFTRLERAFKRFWRSYIVLVFLGVD